MQDNLSLDNQDQHPIFQNVPKQFWLKLEEAYQIFYDALARKDWDNLIPAIRMLREDLGNSPTAHVPIRAVIDMEVVPHLISFLSPKFSHNSRLQFECSWLIVNLTAGNSVDTMYLVKLNIIPILCEFFTNCDENTQENIMWILANISAENDLNLRDQILDLGGLSKVLRQLYATSKTVSYYTTAAWLIANLVRGEPFPEYKKIEKCFGILADFVEDTEDRIKYFSLKSLIYLTQEKEPTKLKPIFQMDFIPKIIKSLTNPREEVGICAIKVIMNLLETNENEFIYMKDNYGASIFQAIEENLMSNCSELRRESLILLNMLFSESEEACEVSLDYDIIPKLIKCIATDNEKMKIIASHCIYKIVSSRFFDQLANEENVAILIDNLSSTDPEFIKSNLLILNKLFEQYEISGRNSSKIKEIILQQNKLAILQSLEKREHDEIKEKATSLLKRLYDDESQ